MATLELRYGLVRTDNLGTLYHREQSPDGPLMVWEDGWKQSAWHSWEERKSDLGCHPLEEISPEDLPIGITLT